MDFILASGSPRRSQLLRDLGIENLKIIPSAADETAPDGLSPAELVKALALMKAEEVFSRTEGERLVLAADTLVFLDDQVLGKPADAEDAKRMLRTLSGREHTVYTGVAILTSGGKRSVRAEGTAVHFRPMSDAEIDWYVSTGEPLDKAGAYGAQGRGCIFVERIEGDFFNVMGLPMCLVVLMLKDLGTEL